MHNLPVINQLKYIEENISKRYLQRYLDEYTRIRQVKVKEKPDILKRLKLKVKENPHCNEYEFTVYKDHWLRLNHDFSITSKDIVATLSNNLFIDSGAVTNLYGLMDLVIVLSRVCHNEADNAGSTSIAAAKKLYNSIKALDDGLAYTTDILIQLNESIDVPRVKLIPKDTTMDSVIGKIHIQRYHYNELHLVVYYFPVYLEDTSGRYNQCVCWMGSDYIPNHELLNKLKQLYNGTYEQWVNRYTLYT